MGNCQAIDAATLVIQHPNGKVDKLYWPVSASEIMKTNPGHYVALLISTTLCPAKPNEELSQHNKKDNKNNPANNDKSSNPVRLTRIKLLRPTDTLVLGQVYRLITTQEVTKGLWAKKQAKLKRNQPEAEMPFGRGREKPFSGPVAATRGSEQDKENQVTKHERHRPKTATGTTATATPSATARSRTWQPSLHSISEATS